MKNHIAALIGIFLSVAVFGQTEEQIKPNQQLKPSNIYSGPIIDMHLHAFTDNNPMFGLTHPPTLRNETYKGVDSAEEQMTKTIAKLREHHIVKAVVTNGQQWMEAAPDIILTGEANKEIDWLKGRHKEGKLQAIAEVAPFYAGVLADDPSQMKYFELAQELGIPVGFHIFPGGPNNGIHLMPQMLGGMRTYNANPLQLEEVLIKYPKVKVYIMHGGWPYVEDVKALMYAHSNVYVDISVLNWILPQEELNTYLKALINAGFGKRIMYGSDQMVWPDVISVGIGSVNQADFLTVEQKEDIFFDNAAEFLGLNTEEIAKLKN